MIASVSRGPKPSAAVAEQRRDRDRAVAEPFIRDVIAWAADGLAVRLDTEYWVTTVQVVATAGPAARVISPPVSVLARRVRNRGHVVSDLRHVVGADLSLGAIIDVSRRPHPVRRLVEGNWADLWMTARHVESGDLPFAFLRARAALQEARIHPDTVGSRNGSDALPDASVFALGGKPWSS